MTRTDRNRLLKLCMLAVPFLFTACAQSDTEHVGAADAKSPPVIAPELPEVIVTASRLEPDERTEEEERRLVARRRDR
jgi:hypothetical protein